eukprot:2668332-Heterocapsa_arctica.AAC.1
MASRAEAGKAPRRLDASDLVRPGDINTTTSRQRPPRPADLYYRYKHPECSMGDVALCGGGSGGGWPCSAGRRPRHAARLRPC